MKLICKFLVLFCIFLTSFDSYSQEIDKLRWKNRVLLIFSNSKNSNKTQNLLANLSKDKKGLKERKLKVFRFSENKYAKDFNLKWFNSNFIVKDFIKSHEDFKLVLIGLDGDVKLETDKVLSIKKIFSTIDGMYMRRRELRNKKY